MIPSHIETANWTDAEYFAYLAMNATALKQLARAPSCISTTLRPPSPRPRAWCWARLPTV